MSKKLIIFLGAASLLLVGGGVVGFMMLKEPPEQVLGPGSEIVDMEEVVLNLRSSKFNFLKIKISLELENPKERSVVILNMPRIKDVVSTYLYSVRQEEMESSMFIRALKEELVIRINRLIAPAKLRDVLIAQLLVS